ncbi:cation transporter [Tianweitania sp. BSSL-BM11]|uniref:Cation transporter n=1 Tax=Tianweitania aestuarii TaxID=2814886 RepID=A0ABS5S1A2_9HYPH|nr:cation transporter [Tianweitania aestuarii]MBS9722327.1 cation transporter [Tianweitania aestuarii]
MTTEASVLRLSILVTLMTAVVGVGFGLLSGSSAILFDGVYSLIDTSMTGVALVVSSLIVRSGAKEGKPRFMERFTMGFWHLEPMVLVLNGTLLMGAAVYALLTAIESLLAGGRVLAFDQGIIYGIITVTTAIVMALLVQRANRRLNSELLALDAKAWWTSAALTASLLIAFLFGYLIDGTRWTWAIPYVDPVILTLICLIVIPIPIGTIKQALSDMLLVTPVEYKREVDTIAEAIVARYNFTSHRAYVAKVGRGRQIELYFIVPVGQPARPLEEWDAIRDEIGDAIGDAGPDRWLTIAFTTDPDWAD